MMRQTEKWFTNRFFDLFFPDEGFGGYSCQLPEQICLNCELTLVVCGAGAGILEATIAKDLCRKASVINIAFIDISDEPLSMLHWILQHHEDNKNNLRAVFDAGAYPRINLEKMYHTSIEGCRINYAFFVEDLELNPNPHNCNYIIENITDKPIRGSFNDFLPHILEIVNSGRSTQKNEIDVVIMSMVLQHLSYWRSLISYFNRYLSAEGFFLVNEFGKDDYLLGFDIANALLSADTAKMSELQKIFDVLIDRQFSILSDNNEICATNIDICRHFFEYWGALCDRTTEANWSSSVSGEFVEALFSTPMFSPFKRYNSLIGIDEKTLSRCILKSTEFEMHFSLHWFLFGKLKDTCSRHFDVILQEQMDADEVCRKLRRYIAEVFEKLQANTTIFSLMRSETLTWKIVPELFDLLGRFCLFRIGDCCIDQLTFFINGYETGYVFPLVNSALCGDVVAQMQLLKEVKQYNISLKQSKIPSSNELFFNVYKDVFTSPFAVVLDPNANSNQFRDNEFHNGFHIVRLECDSACESFSCETILNRKGLSHDVFKLLASQGECIPDKRCALIPCFRENVGTGVNGVGREFTASLIVGYQHDEDRRIQKIEERLLPFYSWLMRSAIEFSGIGVAIDFIRYEHKVQVANTHSAIGCIMSRNGSHNIGSHVLSALSHNVGTMPDDRVLYQYIQHRMDYIASATTGAPDWSVPTPFVCNLMKMFYSQRHLLEHIAESDGLHAYQYQGKGTQTGAKQKDCVKIIVRKIERYKAGEQPEREDENGWQRKEYADKKHSGEKKFVDAYEFFNDAPQKQKGTLSSKPAGDDFHSKESGNDKNSDKTKAVNWNLDEAISVPGGILGQHAFYNIVENVLRNAAKHSWAGKSEKEKEDAGNNLEIFIDFEKPTEKGLMEVEKEEGMIRFTVGDNMSKLFPGKFWEVFFKSHPKLAKDFADPLDGFIVPKEGQDEAKKYHSKRVCLERFLDEKEDVSEGDLPPHYQKLFKYVNENWDKELKYDKEFLSMLQGTDPNDPNTPIEQLKLGHRLPIPLHHRQEIALAKPFIDLETNRLRQAAWGLSEMKISAGYLRRADVSVIGGLKPNVGELPLIVPIGIPRSDRDEKTQLCAFAEKPGELPYQDLCLAYRFWIKLPKDILIVTDHVENWPNFSDDAWEGVSVTSYASIFGNGDTKSKIGLMSDYSFVLIDHNEAIDKNDQLKLPFRALRIAENDEAMPGFPFVSAEELLGKTSKDDFVSVVYRVWLDYLKTRRLGIMRPKDALIVTDHMEDWSRFTGGAWEGIGVASYRSVFGEGGKAEDKEGYIGLTSDYRFVLIDHDKPIEKNNQKKLPFGTLRIADSDEAMPGFPFVSAGELKKTASEDGFVAEVYRALSEHLKNRPLRIKLNIYGKSGGEKGLISDRDIYKVLFRECFHSILEPLAVNDELPEHQQKALLLVSLYPLKENDNLFQEVEEKVEGEGVHLNKIKHFLEAISERVLRFWSSLQCTFGNNCDNITPMIEAYRTGLKRARSNWRVKAIPDALLEELDAAQKNTPKASDPKMLLELKAMAGKSSGSGIVDSAANALDVARTTSDVFLRKYEERIVTLPQQYTGVAKPKDPLLPFRDFGVDIAYGADAPDRPADISYNRHSADGAPLYSEPLSGSQTYLNALSDLSGDDMQWAMRLAENGLLRIVIIDERVRAFISDHGDEIRETYESMRMAVVDTEKPPSFDTSGALPDFKYWNYVAGGLGDFNFDLIIIHQGIIDKWWSDHSKEKVSEILEELRKRVDVREGGPQNRFVVVTTGRGRPDNIPENEKVLAFSAIEAFLFKRYPEKLNLVNSLMSILPGSTERNDNND